MPFLIGCMGGKIGEGGMLVLQGDSIASSFDIVAVLIFSMHRLFEVGCSGSFVELRFP